MEEVDQVGEVDFPLDLLDWMVVDDVEEDTKNAKTSDSTRSKKDSSMKEEETFHGSAGQHGTGSKSTHTSQSTGVPGSGVAVSTKSSVSSQANKVSKAAEKTLQKIPASPISTVKPVSTLKRGSVVKQMISGQDDLKNALGGNCGKISSAGDQCTSRAVPQNAVTKPVNQGRQPVSKTVSSAPKQASAAGKSALTSNQGIRVAQKAQASSSTQSTASTVTSPTQEPGAVKAVVPSSLTSSSQGKAVTVSEKTNKAPVSMPTNMKSVSTVSLPLTKTQLTTSSSVKSMPVKTTTTKSKTQPTNTKQTTQIKASLAPAASQISKASKPITTAPTSQTPVKSQSGSTVQVSAAVAATKTTTQNITTASPSAVIKKPQSSQITSTKVAAKSQPIKVVLKSTSIKVPSTKTTVIPKSAVKTKITKNVTATSASVVPSKKSAAGTSVKSMGKSPSTPTLSASKTANITSETNTTKKTIPTCQSASKTQTRSNTSGHMHKATARQDMSGSLVDLMVSVEEHDDLGCTFDYDVEDISDTEFSESPISSSEAHLNSSGAKKEASQSEKKNSLSSLSTISKKQGSGTNVDENIPRTMKDLSKSHDINQSVGGVQPVAHTMQPVVMAKELVPGPEVDGVTKATVTANAAVTAAKTRDEVKTGAVAKAPEKKIIRRFHRMSQTVTKQYRNKMLQCVIAGSSLNDVPRHVEAKAIQANLTDDSSGAKKLNIDLSTVTVSSEVFEIVASFDASKPDGRWCDRTAEVRHGISFGPVSFLDTDKATFREETLKKADSYNLFFPDKEAGIVDLFFDEYDKFVAMVIQLRKMRIGGRYLVVTFYKPVDKALRTSRRPHYFKATVLFDQNFASTAFISYLKAPVWGKPKAEETLTIHNLPAGISLDFLKLILPDAITMETDCEKSQYTHEDSRLLVGLNRKNGCDRLRSLFTRIFVNDEPLIMTSGLSFNHELPEMKVLMLEKKKKKLEDAALPRDKVRTCFPRDINELTPQDKVKHAGSEDSRKANRAGPRSGAKRSHSAAMSNSAALSDVSEDLSDISDTSNCGEDASARKRNALKLEQAKKSGSSEVASKLAPTRNTPEKKRSLPRSMASADSGNRDRSKRRRLPSPLSHTDRESSDCRSQRTGRPLSAERKSVREIYRQGMLVGKKSTRDNFDRNGQDDYEKDSRGGYGRDSRVGYDRDNLDREDRQRIESLNREPQRRGSPKIESARERLRRERLEIEQEEAGKAERPKSIKRGNEQSVGHFSEGPYRYARDRLDSERVGKSHSEDEQFYDRDTDRNWTNGQSRDKLTAHGFNDHRGGEPPEKLSRNDRSYEDWNKRENSRTTRERLHSTGVRKESRRRSASPRRDGTQVGKGVYSHSSAFSGGSRTNYGRRSLSPRLQPKRISSPRRVIQNSANSPISIGDDDGDIYDGMWLSKPPSPRSVQDVRKKSKMPGASGYNMLDPAGHTQSRASDRKLGYRNEPQNTPSKRLLNSDDQGILEKFVENLVSATKQSSDKNILKQFIPGFHDPVKFLEKIQDVCKSAPTSTSSSGQHGKPLTYPGLKKFNEKGAGRDLKSKDGSYKSATSVRKGNVMAGGDQQEPRPPPYNNVGRGCPPRFPHMPQSTHLGRGMESGNVNFANPPPIPPPIPPPMVSSVYTSTSTSSYERFPRMETMPSQSEWHVQPPRPSLSQMSVPPPGLPLHMVRMPHSMPRPSLNMSANVPQMSSVDGPMSQNPNMDSSMPPMPMGHFQPPSMEPPPHMGPSHMWPPQPDYSY